MLILGNCLDVLPTLAEKSVQCVVTSPPYFGLRDYGHADQIGLEPTPDDYVVKLVNVFRHVWRVLRDDGTIWLNLGDSYAGSNKGLGADGTHYAGEKQASSRAWAIGKGKRTLPRLGGGNIPAPNGLKPKDLIGIPWRVAFALQADGWWLRSDIIWHKPNPMPESVTDRPTKAHEYLFLLTKSSTYYYDALAVAEPVAASTIGRGSVTFGGAKGVSFVANMDKDDPNYRNGSEQWGREYKYGETRLNKNNRAYSFARETATTPPPGQRKQHREDREDIAYNGDVRNRRSVWTIATAPYKGAHFATFPPALVEPCILAGCPVGGTVLDPFAGSGTVGAVARATGREFVGIEINADYIRLAEQRIGAVPVPLLVTQYANGQ